MAYCTILSDGAPHRFYPTKEAALAAGRRHFARTGEGVEVVWCNDCRVPKLWLAYVTLLGVEKTAHWSAAS